MVEIFIYDDIGSYFGGYSDKQAIEDVAKVSSNERIKLRINSHGGDYFEGVAIHTAFSQHPGGVDVQIDGVAASAASVIATAGESVTIAQGAYIMIHEGSSGMHGTANDHRATAELLDGINETAAKIYAARTGKNYDEIRADMAAETWLKSDSAVEYGLADSVLESVVANVSDVPAKFHYHNAPDMRQTRCSSLSAAVKRLERIKSLTSTGKVC